MKLKKVEKRTEHGIAYTTWDEKVLKKFPIEKKHIGVPVKVAFSSRSKDYVLKEIKEVGDPGFPRGGYLVTDPEAAFSKPLFIEEVICFPPKKKRKKRTSKKKTAKTKTKTRKNKK